MKWPITTLGQVAEFINGDRGKNYPSEGDFVDDGIPFINAGHLVDGIVDFSKMNFISESRYTLLNSGKTRQNDILYCLRGSLGKTAVVRWKENAAIASSLVIIRPENNCNVDYLYHYLTSPLGQLEVRKFDNGSSQPNLSATSVKSYRLPLPPLPEQLRIAAILGKAEGLRAKRRTALAKLDSLSHAIFVEMFGDPGSNEKDWPRRSLKELGRVQTGGTPPSAKTGMFDGPIPFVTPGDLESDAPVKRSLTVAGAEESVTVRAGATMVCCIGATIGKISMARERSAFNQQINSIEWSEEVDDLYGFHALRFFKPTIIAWGASTTLPILKKSSFERIEIPVPPLPLQRVFAQRAQSVESLRKVHRASLEHMNQLFFALQQRAFKGEL